MGDSIANGIGIWSGHGFFRPASFGELPQCISHLGGFIVLRPLWPDILLYDQFNEVSVTDKAKCL
jgi:hypothetical protein